MFPRYLHNPIRCFLIAIIIAGGISSANAGIQPGPDSLKDFTDLLTQTIQDIKDSLAKDCLKSVEASRMLTLLEDDYHRTTVIRVRGRHSDTIPADEILAMRFGIGSNATVHWDPDDVAPIEGEPNVARQPAAELLHELFHASKMVEGRWIPSSASNIPFGQEAVAVSIENAYRRGKGLPQRTKYGAVLLAGWIHPDCCTADQVACRGSCCGASQSCTIEGCTSCPAGQSLCGGKCCDKTCTNNQCVCADTQIACGSGCCDKQQCLQSIDGCCVGASTCCLYPTLCCGGTCCGLSTTKQPIACCPCNGTVACSSLGTSVCPPCPKP